MIECVLATDMSKHFAELAHFKIRAEQTEFDLTQEKDKMMTVKLFFHLADISNPVKDWKICKDWTDLLYTEFFAQGDLERNQGFPISYLMDRHTTNIAKAQIGFYDFIIKPSYEQLIKVCPELQVMMD